MRGKRNLQNLDCTVIVTSSLYYERQDFEELVQLFSNLTVEDFRLRTYLDVIQSLLTAGSLDKLPTRPGSRKKKVVRLVNEKLAAIPDSQSRDRITAWFNEAAEQERDIELAQELLYRYCWADFLDRAAQQDESDIPFRDKLSIRPVIPDIGKREVKALADVVMPTSQESIDSQVFETGIVSLDDIVKMRKTNFVVIAARTTVGKSLFMINQAIYNAGQGTRVLYVSLEESDVELKNRVQLHIDANNSSDEAYKENVMKNFIIYTPGTSSPTTVLDESARIMRENDIGVIFIDYIQLMRYPGMSDWDSLRALTRELKLYAIKNNVLLVTASQLKREVEYTGANISSMYGSSTIENDANIILLLSSIRRESVRIDNTMAVKIDVAKNRSGQQGTVDNLLIDYSCGHIEESGGC